MPTKSEKEIQARLRRAAKKKANTPDYSMHFLVAGLAAVGFFLFTMMGPAPEFNDAGVREVNDNDFDSAVKETSMVMFYAPWCGHCKEQKPRFAEAALLPAEERFNTQFVQCDCQNKCAKTCTKFGIKSYPQYYLVRGSVSAEFLGGRAKDGFLKGAEQGLDEMKRIADEKAAKKAEEDEALRKAEAASNVTFVSDEDFESPDFFKPLRLMKFYAPWCGHCKALAPAWDAMALDDKFAKKGITVCKADCTGKAVKMCSVYKVESYPVIMLMQGKAKIKYDGERTQEAISEWALGGLKKAFQARKAKLAQEKEEARLREIEYAESPVTYLTSKDFNRRAFKNSPHFIKFFAPWCGHCKALAPTWEELAEDEEIKEAGIVVAKADCTGKAKVACEKHSVRGYPVIKFVSGGEEVKYELEARDFDSLKELVLLNDVDAITAEIASRTAAQEAKKKEEARLAKEAEENSPVSYLTSEDFHTPEFKATPHLVKFYAPWCGHCKALAPVWEELAGDDEVQAGGVVVAKADCTGKARSACDKHNVQSYPVIKYIHGEDVIAYEQGRDFNSFKELLVAGDTQAIQTLLDARLEAQVELEKQQGLQ